MKKENLVFMVYDRWGDGVEILEETSRGCTLNLENKTWEFDGKRFKIGTEERYCEYGCRWGVIGVYDRTNIHHIRNMVYDAKKAVSGPPTARPDDD
ncbi:MAG: hypothetical protein AAB792_02195 [Patescibacteria group bacterium]